MNYNSFNDFLKAKIGTEIVIADEQAYDMLNDNITVIIKYLRGNIYTSSTYTPIILEILTTDVNTTRDLFDDFAKRYNNKTFVKDSGEVVLMTFNTTFINNSFNRAGNNYVTSLQMMGTLIESMNSNDIAYITIDDAIYEAPTRTLVYASTVDNQRYGQSEINKSQKMFATVSLNLSMLNKDNDFCNKLSQIRCGILTGNTKFDVEIVYMNSLIENYSMIVESHSLNSVIGAHPMITVVMRC